MNRLNRTQTVAWFENSGDYAALRAQWSRLMHDVEARKGLTAAHHLLYLALLGRDWRKGFCPITNQTKLDNGAFWNMGARRAIQDLHNRSLSLAEPFEGRVSGPMIEAVRELIPKLAW